MLPLAALIFLSILHKIIFLDVILSLVHPFWAWFRKKFISPILDPFYNFIRRFLNLRVWIFDFSPIVLILLVMMLAWVITKYFPEVTQYVSI